MQTVTLDLSRKNIIPPVHAKQGDVGRKFKVVLTDAGVAYTVPRGAQFSLWFSGSSGEGNYSAIGENSAFVVEGNTVVVELITQMLNNAGTCSMCLVLTGADGSQLGLWNMVVIVESVPGLGSAAAEQYYTALSEVAEKAVKAAETFQTDTTMTVSGRAADAAAVGNLLKGKAPAGYGLGMSECAYPPNADANQISANGFWQCYVNCPDSANWYVYREAHIVGTYEHQSAIRVIDGQRAERTMVGGVWQPWEWVNPPMVPTTEYRTTERYNGKPVYVKLVDFGALPNNTRKTVSHGSSNIQYCFGSTVTFYAGQIGTEVTNWSNITNVTVDRDVVTIATNGDQSWASVYVAIKYTKTTG